jgi:hypothetical protein
VRILVNSIITTNTIIGILIIFSGIILLRYFVKRKVENISYKPAIFIYIIWFIISFFGLSFLYNLITQSYFSLDNPQRVVLLNIHSIINLIIELFIISILINYFYKIAFEDSIFMAVQVMSVQILMRIILANILAIIFNLTTGGFIFLYIFQY